jgi:FkbM family methyltransferase
LINFSKIDNRHLVGRFLRLPLGLIPKNMMVPILQGPMKGLRWKVGSSDHGCWLGTYELEEQLFFTSIVRPGMVVWDVGANVGVYTLLFSRLVMDSGEVLAFEPMPSNSDCLIGHVRANNLSNVTVFQTAISDRKGFTGFSMHPSNSMGSMTEGSSGLMVSTIPLDSLVLEHNYPFPGVIKMDVEGAEALVLAGSERILSKGLTRWVVSLHSVEQMDRCQERFRAHGYRLFSLGGSLITGPLREAGITDIYAVPQESESD